ncbi:hypothetical protein CGRA01v4_03371 [Colletotrichum graminicola]|nr:hypothetical protein CGRA01v4_03371 [Colletotrichum graminicola]
MIISSLPALHFGGFTPATCYELRVGKRLGGLWSRTRPGRPPSITFSMWIMLELQHAMTWSCINETGPLIFSPFIVHLRRAPIYIQSWVCCCSRPEAFGHPSRRPNRKMVQEKCPTHLPLRGCSRLHLGPPRLRVP